MLTLRPFRGVRKLLEIRAGRYGVNRRYQTTQQFHFIYKAHMVIDGVYQGDLGLQITCQLVGREPCERGVVEIDDHWREEAGQAVVEEGFDQTKFELTEVRAGSVTEVDGKPAQEFQLSYRVA